MPATHLQDTATHRPSDTKKGSRRRPRRSAYHHGDLRRALVEAALEIAGERGADAVTVREAARRAGVSPGAPFRHFADRTMLMTAVAEEAGSRLRAEMAAGLRAARTRDPIGRLHTLGTSYLRWVARNPTHFQIVSRRDSIDFEGSAALTADNAAIRAQMHALFAEALDEGRLRASNLRLTEIVCRAFVYGLARMHTDGHFPSWNVSPEESEAVMAQALRLFVSLLASDRESGSTRGAARRRAGRTRASRSGS